jgi:uncharacterized protein (DUF1330 family)
MKTNYKLAIALVAGAAIGGAAIQGLHAQAKPPIYQISEITPTDLESFMKDYVPGARAAIKAAGGRLLAAGKPTSVDGDPPKPRVTVTMWDNMDKYQAYRDSAAFKELLPTRDKVAKFSSFTVEAVSQ